MTDEQQDTSNKDGRKPTSNPAAGTNRGQRRNPSVAKPSNSATQPPKPGSNKKPGTPAPESGSENGKKANDGKKSEQRRQPQSGGGQGKASNRKGQSTAGQNSRNNGQSSNKPGTLAPPPDSSDALSSLQRVIADLKTTSPPNQPAPLAGNTLPSSTSAPIAQTTPSNLPANAPVFQPGASIYPPPTASEPPPRHRKAASMGAAGLSSNFGNFAPHLGSMREDVEDGQNVYEEGEIQDIYTAQPQAHHPRSQSQSFTAPRFAALAAQQEQQQIDVLGPSGRPQLAPGFMFGARQRSIAMGPPINEEDVGFQFPQQQTVPSYSDQEVMQRRNEGGGEIRGIMAEQVRFS